MPLQPPTLVLLPGMDGTGDLFAPLLDALGERFETIVVRYPLHEPLDYAGLLPIARAALPVDRRFLLVAESFSGPLGIVLAAEAAPGLDGLILCGSFARNPRPALAGFGRWSKALPLNAAMVRIAIAATLGGRVEASTRKLIERTVARLPAPVLATRLRAVLEVDVGRELSKVNAPILYLQATRDRAVPPSAADVIRHVRPDADLVRLDGPHFLLQANPLGAAAEIARFATATGPRASPAG